jgi:hypothetical protein
MMGLSGAPIKKRAPTEISVWDASGRFKRSKNHHHTVPYGTGYLCSRFQALRTWLPSFYPYGTDPQMPLVRFRQLSTR